MSSGQFGHISQFYQTLLLICIFILAGFEIFSFVFNIHQKIFKLSINEYREQLQWSTHKVQSLQTAQQPSPQQQQQNDLQKSVTNYVQNQITNMEKTHQQPHPQQGNQGNQNPYLPSQEPEEPQLPPNKLKFFTVYVAFNNFISQKMAILIPLLIMGILTASTYVYTLVAFFCAFICDLIVEILTVQQSTHNLQNSKFGLKQGVKILGNAFVLSIFISYWAVQQFTAS